MNIDVRAEECKTLNGADHAHNIADVLRFVKQKNKKSVKTDMKRDQLMCLTWIYICHRESSLSREK